jgi:HTH-type transcriptional regulator/antitoxin HigA
MAVKTATRERRKATPLTPHKTKAPKPPKTKAKPLTTHKATTRPPAKVATRAMPNSYFKLVGQFPLTRIRDDAHLRAAQAVIDGLLREHLDRGGEAYLDALTDLVGRYEDEHEPIPDAPEADVLRVLMTANRLSQQDLARAVGIAQSTLSAVLNGARKLTKGQVITLARYFHVAPAAFLPARSGRT